MLLLKIWDYIGRTVCGWWGLLCAKTVFKLSGCKVGRGLRVFGTIVSQISRTGSIQIGENVTMISRRKSNLSGIAHPTTLQTIKEGVIQIGDNVGMSGVVISSRKAIRVGAFTKIGVNVKIYDHDYHSIDYMHRRDPVIDKVNVRSREVVIGEDVFIGGHSVILKGTRVGDRSIIGAGSVVAGLDIPPDSIVAGNPAKILNKK